MPFGWKWLGPLCQKKTVAVQRNSAVSTGGPEASVAVCVHIFPLILPHASLFTCCRVPPSIYLKVLKLSHCLNFPELLSNLLL